MYLVEIGIIQKELLCEYPNGILCSHVHNGVPGVTVTTGSLGHGLGTAVGMAEALRLSGRSDTVYCVMGDGECQEGSVWEAARLAVASGLDNLVVVVDRNGIGATGFVNGMDWVNHWNSLGWEVRMVNGHSVDKLMHGFWGIETKQTGRPLVIVANTVKGHGVAFMENQPIWHSRVPEKGEVEKVMEALA